MRRYTYNTLKIFIPHPDKIEAFFKVYRVRDFNNAVSFARQIYSEMDKNKIREHIHKEILEVCKEVKKENRKCCDYIRRVHLCIDDSINKKNSIRFFIFKAPLNQDEIEKEVKELIEKRNKKKAFREETKFEDRSLTVRQKEFFRYSNRVNFKLSENFTTFIKLFTKKFEEKEKFEMWIKKKFLNITTENYLTRLVDSIIENAKQNKNYYLIELLNI